MAPTGDVLFWTFLILGFLIALGAAQLLVTALLPRMVERSGAALRRRPLVCLGCGAATLVATILLFKGLQLLGQPGTVVALGAVVCVVTTALTGLAAFSRRVGERLPSAIDVTSPWRPVLRGAIVSELAFATPVVGWLVFGLTILCAGGAGVFGGLGLHALAGRLRRGPVALPDAAA